MHLAHAIYTESKLPKWRNNKFAKRCSIIVHRMFKHDLRAFWTKEIYCNLHKVHPLRGLYMGLEPVLDHIINCMRVGVNV